MVTPEPTPEIMEVPDVEVEALTSTEELRPGEAGRLRFRLTNTGDTDAAVQVTTTNSLAEWGSELLATDGASPLKNLITVSAGASIEVVVRVTAPADAYVGDTNTITLFAAPADAPPDAANPIVEPAVDPPGDLPPPPAGDPGTGDLPPAGDGTPNSVKRPGADKPGRTAKADRPAHERSPAGHGSPPPGNRRDARAARR